MEKYIKSKDDVIKNPTIIKRVLEEIFNIITREYNLCKNYQKRAFFHGKAFQAFFEVLMHILFPEIRLLHDCKIIGACFTEGSEADFVVIDQDNRILAIIETKGSASYIKCNESLEELKRPGLIRTDTVKKAICNAVQTKFGISNDVLYIIVTSHKPKEGTSSDCMLRLVIGKLVDMVVDITDYTELERMVKLIRSKSPPNIVYDPNRGHIVNQP